MSKDIKVLLDKTIEEKIFEFIRKYKYRPRYLKIPLWILKDLKEQYMGLMKIDYISGRFCYEGLYICETPTIKNIEEIEVF